MIKQFKLSPEILVLQRKIPDDNTICAIKGFTLFCGVCLTSLVLHISFTKPQAKKWGKLFRGSGLILYTFLFFFWIQSFWKHRGFSLGKIWLIRRSRTKLLWFLKFLPFLGETLWSSRYPDLFSPPTQAPFWCGNIATCDLSREGGELCTSDQAPEKAGLSWCPQTSSEFRVLYIRICQPTATKDLRNSKCEEAPSNWELEKCVFIVVHR